MNNSDLLPLDNSLDHLSYDDAVALKKNISWKKFAQVSVQQAAETWLATIKSEYTRKNYQSGMVQLEKKAFLNITLNLQAFALINHENVIDQIKLVDDWSEATRQARAALYISFTGFLSRRTEGLIRKALPSREGLHKTFFRVRNYVKTRAMNQYQWNKFLDELAKINPRDTLIAKLLLQGGKRKSEVLTLQAHQINFELGEITFRQAKTKGSEKITIITYSTSIMEELQRYLTNRKGLVFVTRNGKAIKPNQIDRNFRLAGERAGNPFRVTPHVLRASTVTHLKREGFPDSDIMKVTGHSSSEMIYMYDKSSRADNPSKKLSLI